jgi:hypothetical protein
VAPHFNGSDYDPAYDDGRLANQHERVKRVMLSGEWRALFEISELTGDPPASVSAQLRHMRKKRFGSFVVEKRIRGTRENGLYEYRVSPAEWEVDTE